MTWEANSDLFNCPPTFTGPSNISFKLADLAPNGCPDIGLLKQEGEKCVVRYLFSILYSPLERQNPSFAVERQGRIIFRYCMNISTWHTVK